MGPQVYLDDSAWTAAAVRKFVAVLGPTGCALARAQLGLQRRSAARIDDNRLEQQRLAVVGPLHAVVAQLSAIATSAQTGDAAAVVADLAALRTAQAALQQAGA